MGIYHQTRSKIQNNYFTKQTNSMHSEIDTSRYELSGLYVHNRNTTYWKASFSHPVSNFHAAHRYSRDFKVLYKEGLFQEISIKLDQKVQKWNVVCSKETHFVSWPPGVVIAVIVFVIRRLSVGWISLSLVLQSFSDAYGRKPMFFFLLRFFSLTCAWPRQPTDSFLKALNVRIKLFLS